MTWTYVWEMMQLIVVHTPELSNKLVFFFFCYMKFKFCTDCRKNKRLVSALCSDWPCQELSLTVSLVDILVDWDNLFGWDALVSWGIPVVRYRCRVKYSSWVRYPNCVRCPNWVWCPNCMSYPRWVRYPSWARYTGWMRYPSWLRDQLGKKA